MTDNNKIEIKLSHQFNLIWEAVKSLEYLINFPIYLEQTGNDKPKDLWFLYFVIRNNTILNLHKLYNPNEDYSFDKVKRIFIADLDKSDEKVKDYLKSIKIAKKLYDKLEIKDIRNKHVGHLDDNRTKKSIDWKQVEKLIQLSCDIHDKINSYFFNKQSAWIIDNKTLNSIYTNNLRSIKLFELKRKLFGEDIINVERDEILSLTKINWP